TKVMDIYGKSAPLLALIAFTLQLRDRKLETIANREKLITASIFSPFFYAFYAYFFLWNNFELTTAGRTVRWMSDNALQAQVSGLTARKQQAEKNKAVAEKAKADAKAKAEAEKAAA
ncbi:colicin immunity protein Cui, partial [Escherichia coli]|uniref:colicin immunity protein Cui n=1 Tax=Escherichia coli TaxID=562 RepID=UPI000B25E164